MAHRRVKDLAVKVGEFDDGSGNKKARWHNIGVMMEDDNGGQYIMLDRYFNPAGVPNPEFRGTLLVSMFDTKSNQQQQPQQRQAPPAQRQAPQPQRQAPRPAPQPSGAGADDDVPF